MANWKSLLTKHDKLVKQSGRTLFERVSILRMVYTDPDFAKTAREEGKTTTALLDEKVRDTCANITELFQMLEMFPDKVQWEKGSLDQMRLQMLEKLRRRVNPEAGQKKKSPARKTATLAEVSEMKTQIKESNSEVSHLKKQLAEKERTIKNLEAALESARETIGSLNETISLLKIKVKAETVETA